MSFSDATPQRPRRPIEELPAIPVSLSEELAETPSRQHYPNLAGGIVWADILADIAADDEARRLRAAEQMPDAA